MIIVTAIQAWKYSGKPHPVGFKKLEQTGSLIQTTVSMPLKLKTPSPSNLETENHIKGFDQTGALIMQDKVLKLDELKTWFDKVTETVSNEQAEIEVAGLNLGDQIVAEWVPVAGLSHDPKDDVISVILKDYEHLINKPKRVVATTNGADLVSILIEDSEGTEHIIRFREPLALPPAA